PRPRVRHLPAPVTLPNRTPISSVAQRYGELQIAASDSATSVVYGTQNGPFFSLDDGTTIGASSWNTVKPPGTPTFQSDGDPSVAIGAPDAAGLQTYYFSTLVAAPGNTDAIALFQ